MWEKWGNLEIDQISQRILVFYPKPVKVEEFNKISLWSTSKCNLQATRSKNVPLF